MLNELLENKTFVKYAFVLMLFCLLVSGLIAYTAKDKLNTVVEDCNKHYTSQIEKKIRQIPHFQHPGRFAKGNYFYGELYTMTQTKFEQELEGKGDI